jgi:hypothetical protein
MKKKKKKPQSFKSIRQGGGSRVRTRIYIKSLHSVNLMIVACSSIINLAKKKVSLKKKKGNQWQLAKT